MRSALMAASSQHDLSCRDAQQLEKAVPISSPRQPGRAWGSDRPPDSARAKREQRLAGYEGRFSNLVEFERCVITKAAQSISRIHAARARAFAGFESLQKGGGSYRPLRFDGDLAAPPIDGSLRQELRERVVQRLVIPLEQQEVRCTLHPEQNISVDPMSAYRFGASAADLGSCSPTTRRTGAFTRNADDRFHPASTPLPVGTL